MATENTSKKNATFLSTPFNSVTSLTQIPGVGTTTLEKLTKAGITAPSQLIGQFLLLNKDPDAMRQWLQSACAVRQREGTLIANALAEKTGRMEML